MQKLKLKIKQTLQRIKNIKLRKIHLEYVTAILSIPVLITVIIINVGNLAKKNEVTPTPTPSTTQQVKIPPFDRDDVDKNPSVAPTSEICKKSIGPISITFPTEDQTVSDNPVCVIIDYSDSDYCSVVWSYRINDDTWSEYNSNSPCLYNLPNEDVSFELRVKSTVISEQKVLTRKFKYIGDTTATTPTPTPTSTPTPTVSTTPTTTPTPTQP
jgi:hypothetical protein